MSVSDRFTGKRSVKTTDLKPAYGNDLDWTRDLNQFNFMSKENGNKLKQFRLVGGMYIMARHWLKTQSGKAFLTYCTLFDGTSQDPNTEWQCPTCRDFGDRPQLIIIVNAIDRDSQVKGDRNPIVTLILPHLGFYSTLLNIAKMNGDHPVEDIKYGKDLGIMFLPQEKGNKKWNIINGERTPLTEVELNYDYPDLETIIPDFNDTVVRQQWYDQNYKSLVNNMYYIRQTQVDILPSSPWASFAKDFKGVPWTTFPELVLFEQSKPDQRYRKLGTPVVRTNVQKHEYMSLGQQDAGSTPEQNARTMSQILDDEDENFDLHSSDVPANPAPAPAPVPPPQPPSPPAQKRKPPQCYFDKEYGKHAACNTTCPNNLRNACVARSSKL